ncbi:MAG: hypothetical protein IPP23_12460 [Sphingomonadales bacterium]|nr:hypothetical protein [Sphingomonadales bacterium]
MAVRPRSTVRWRAHRWCGGFIADWISLLDEAPSHVAATIATRQARSRTGDGNGHACGSVSTIFARFLVSAKGCAGAVPLRGQRICAFRDGALHLLNEASGEFCHAFGTREGISAKFVGNGFGYRGGPRRVPATIAGVPVSPGTLLVLFGVQPS